MRSRRSLAAVFALFAGLSGGVVAQGETPFETPEDLTTADAGTREERQQASRRVLELLSRNAASAEEAAAVAGMLELSLDREAFADRPLGPLLDRVSASEDPTDRQKAWLELRDALCERTAHIVRGMHAAEIGPAEAERLLRLAKYTLMAFDDARDPNPMTGRSSALTRLLTSLHGVAAATKGIQDQKASDLMEAFRDIVSQCSRKAYGETVRNPAQAFEIPAAVAAAIIDHNRKGLEEITSVLDRLPAAMDGDPEALKAMLEGSKRVEQVISGEAYGRAIWDAMSDRIVARIPFVRTLAAWYGSRLSPAKVAPWVGEWVGSWNDVRIAADGKITPIGNGLFSRRGGTITARYATDTTLEGTWEFAAIGIKGTFSWTMVEQDHFRGYRIQEGSDVRLNWEATKLRNR